MNYSSWMSDSLADIGNQTLQNLCLPASHDAGMSSLAYGTDRVMFNMVCTQVFPIGGQLINGARYFDIRPVLAGNTIYTGHFDSTTGSVHGGLGQTIESIVADINAFTAINNELIILELSHDMVINSDITSSSISWDAENLNQEQWNQVFNVLSQINGLVPDLQLGDILTTTINEYICAGPAVIVLIDAESEGIIVPSNFPGIILVDNNGDSYTSGGYYQTDDLQTMITYQLSQLQAKKLGYFATSWTLTLSTEDIIYDVAEDDVISIIGFAVQANATLAQLTAACSATLFPNVIYINLFGYPLLTEAVIALNAQITSLNKLPQV